MLVTHDCTISCLRPRPRSCFPWQEEKLNKLIDYFRYMSQKSSGSPLIVKIRKQSCDHQDLDFYKILCGLYYNTNKLLRLVPCLTEFIYYLILRWKQPWEWEISTPETGEKSEAQRSHTGVRGETELSSQTANALLFVLSLRGVRTKRRHVNEEDKPCLSCYVLNVREKSHQQGPCFPKASSTPTGPGGFHTVMPSPKGTRAGVEAKMQAATKLSTSRGQIRQLIFFPDRNLFVCSHSDNKLKNSAHLHV